MRGAVGKGERRGEGREKIENKKREGKDHLNPFSKILDAAICETIP